MSDFDDTLKHALTDEREQLDELVAQSQPGLIELLLGAFRGQSILMNIMFMVPGLVFTVLAVLSIFWFFDAQTVRDQIMFATIFMTCNLIVMTMKIWFWMVMNRNATTREIKRLEIQVAELSRKLGG
ncbi:MAG: hypothetical protein IIC49_05910 [Planctomycetes bacterium]|nr:hypothetical protein [Planctomycetota bacterium]